MASGSTDPVDVFMDDLEATLHDTDKAASSIQLKLVAGSATHDRFSDRATTLEALMAVSAQVAAETRRLCDNVRAAQATLDELRSELARRRMARRPKG